MVLDQAERPQQVLPLHAHLLRAPLLPVCPMPVPLLEARSVEARPQLYWRKLHRLQNARCRVLLLARVPHLMHPPLPRCAVARALQVFLWPFLSARPVVRRVRVSIAAPAGREKSKGSQGIGYAAIGAYCGRPAAHSRIDAHF